MNAAELNRLLALISEAAFANPFGKVRDRLDSEISGVAANHPEVLERMVQKLGAVIGGLPARSIKGLSGTDRELVEHALLFDLFHRFAQVIDEFIEAQRSDASLLAAPFIEELLGEFSSLGLARDRSERMLALFYQMRRAYYFIAGRLVGTSPSMARLREALWNAVFTRDIRVYDGVLWDRMEDFSTLLVGATGTGKGAAAEAIGLAGFVPYDRSSGAFSFHFESAFIPINLSQYAESLIESELFGHKKGAFTGATEAHQGVLSQCVEHGSVFLDEIGEVRVPVQIKLLRVLQERSFQPVGSHHPRAFRGRVIAATHRNVSELRASGGMRDDFFYRLCSDVIEVPPLCERLHEQPEELQVLLEAILERITGRSESSVVTQVREIIARDVPAGYAWPGNVRELEQCARRALLSGTAGPDRFRAEVAAGKPFEAIGEVSTEALLGDYVKHLYEKHGAYVAVADITGLDRRTVKKYVEADSGGC